MTCPLKKMRAIFSSSSSDCEEEIQIRKPKSRDKTQNSNSIDSPIRRYELRSAARKRRSALIESSSSSSESCQSDSDDGEDEEEELYEEDESENDYEENVSYSEDSERSLHAENMPKDYYHILGISRNASSNEIRKAYFKMALEWHPDKNKSHGAVEKFKEIGEAYFVLSNPEKRKIFDESWDDQRNGGSRANGSRGFDHFTFQDDPMQMFRRAFGRSESFTDNNEFIDPFKFMGVRMDNTGRCKRRKQNTHITHDVQVSLPDIWSGCSKKMKVLRKIFSPDGAFRTAEKVLTVNIEPGARSETKIIFLGEGNQKPGYAPGDIVFVIKEQPHPKFKREDYDIRYIQKLSLRDALCGISIKIATLSGAIVPFKSAKVITPNSTERIPGFGLPDPNNGGQRGDLIIEFHVRFPVILLSDSIQLKQLK